MSVKKNYLFSTVLTVSNYIFPIITFPYVSRKLGVDNIGICNYVDSVIQYYVGLSMLGVSILGVREIAKNKQEKSNLNSVFSSVLFLNCISTLAAIILLVFLTHNYNIFHQHKELYYIGAAKIFLNFISIEWFFKGIEKFSFITVRSVIFKLIYVAAVFLFIKDKNDYVLYYLLTVGLVFVNATINFVYSNRFVKFSLRSIQVTKYLLPFLTLGLYILLNSMHSTFNTAYLGYRYNDKQVGLFTTAVKIITLSISFISPLSNIMLPRISNLIGGGNEDIIISYINKSIKILMSVSIPIIIYIVFYAYEIIFIMTGDEYIESSRLIKICAPLILINGLEQICIVQILMPYGKDKAILVSSIIGMMTGVISAFFLISNFGSVGSCFSWLISEFSILVSSLFVVRSILKIKIVMFDKKTMFKSALYLLFNAVLANLFINVLFLKISISIIVNLVIFFTMEFFIFKELVYVNFYNSMCKKSGFAFLEIKLPVIKA